MLPLSEWAVLQQHFGDFQLATGGPENLAMFIQDDAGDDESAIYITGPGIQAIEAHSPGGWQDSKAPSGPGISLLVGAGDPWKYFGIEYVRD